ncbi:Protein of unknown function [Pyronema omphalodes CBS 100304]|uniref:Uncharacterized protein n=1 Tax=Pyronema omphalodes (strain CBS 100304) TaxID=1076935 RepID=U4LJH3_PYROM|nr:Protein of unknown function [Pyronema omphalodes CBS 100304]
MLLLLLVWLLLELLGFTLAARLALLCSFSFRAARAALLFYFPGIPQPPSLLATWFNLPTSHLLSLPSLPSNPLLLSFSLLEDHCRSTYFVVRSVIRVNAFKPAPDGPCKGRGPHPILVAILLLLLLPFPTSPYLSPYFSDSDHRRSATTVKPGQNKQLLL